MKHWIITDTHFGHRKLVEHGRPEDFENRIIKSLKVIQKDDILIHLGDICIGNDEQYNRIFTNLECKKFLIKGNHDNKSYQWYYDKGWDFVCETMRLRYKGKEIIFSHYPVLEKDSNYTIYLKVDVNIHGHLHGGGKESHRAISGYDKDNFNIDVAPDTHDYKLVDLDKIINKLTK